MKERRFTDKEILYIALRFFKKIDEIEFKIIRDIVARNFGEERVYKDIMVLDDLCAEVKVKEKEALNGEVIKEFFLPPQNVDGSDEYQIRKHNPGIIFFENIDEELFKFLYLMSLNAEELSLRKIAYDPRASFLSNFELKRRTTKLYKRGLLNGINYSSNITEKDIEGEEDIQELQNMLDKLIQMYLNDKDSEELRQRIKYFERKGNILIKSFELTEKGMEFLREKMSEIGIYNPKDRCSKRHRNLYGSDE